MRKLPRVVAHRGASEVDPEHTLAAYQRAIEIGADGLECDVRLTADGHLVCVHDRRIDRTSNGRGVLSTMSLEELESYDWGSWKRPWAELDEDAELPGLDVRKVLTLETLLATVRDAGRPVELAIETKHPTRYAGLVERRLVDLLDSVGWAGADSPARIMSFSPVALNRIKKLAPAIEVVLLFDRQYSWQMATSLLGPGWIAGPGIDLLRESPKLGRRLRKRNRRVHVWTVNTPEDLDLCAGLGVEAVITDDPRMALDHFDGPSALHLPD